MEPLTYRQWLQMKANDTSGQVPSDVIYSKMLLDIAGNDGSLDANAVGENRQFKGDDGQIYYTAGGEGDFADGGKGLIDVNKALFTRYNNYRDDPNLVSQVNQSTEGYSSGGGFTSGGGGVSAAEQQRLAAEAAERAKLRSQITSRGGEIDSVYNSLFNDLEGLVSARDAELETQYGDQLGKASEQFAGALPQIENSYAALGAFDSTDTADAKTGAKKGFDETTETIGKNKKADKAALGQYERETRGGFEVDRDAARRNVGRVDETEDVDALRGFRNDLESNLGSAKKARTTLGTDGAARKQITEMTGDKGRYEAAINALDSILKSSMSGAVKEAAVSAVTDSAGLSDEEKEKVQKQYGNVYAEQAAL